MVRDDPFDIQVSRSKVKVILVSRTLCNWSLQNSVPKKQLITQERFTQDTSNLVGL